ncbi:MAG: zinc ABC transporter substrate-binding protein [Porticoccaceae bacterium]|nr:zinc ABC transporter substrate-binding protein [Porticoccaceae bacterium]
MKKIHYNISGILILFFALNASGANSESSKYSESLEVSQMLVVTTNKPLAIIARAALGDSARVEFLQSASQSAHDLTLSISALGKMQKAQLVVLLGDEVEPRVAKAVSVLPKHRVIRVLDLPFLRSDKESKQVSDDHQRDPHVWLDPQNGNLIGRAIQDRVGVSGQDIIRDVEVTRLSSILAPYAKKRYLTHHDAFGHFARGFGLASGLSIRDAGGRQKGAKSQYLLRKEALANTVECVFVEPQYANKDAQGIAATLNLPIISIDPQGTSQPLIDEGYEQFMQRLVAQFRACFS